MAKFVIRHATENDQKAWDDYVLDHPNGTAYQLFAWQHAVVRAYGFAHCSLLAEEGGRVRGILPLIHFRAPLLGETLVSLPYCDAGGVLADNSDIAGRLLEFASPEVAQHDPDIDLRSTHELSVDAVNRTDKVRMLLELPKSADELLSGLKSKLRSQVKKPLRDGLTAKLGGSELVKEFYPIFARNMRDLGSPVHSRRWIESVVAEYGERCRVGVVYTPDGIPAAAGIILLHRKTVSIPWASALREFNRLNPNMLLYWIFLAFAADNGYRSFDFGRSTPEEGTYRFKQQWGAQPKPLYWYRLQDRKSVSDEVGETDQQRSSGKRELLAGIWQKLPVPVATVLGSQIRKYITL